jgi:hypothetical protein
MRHAVIIFTTVALISLTGTASLMAPKPKANLRIELFFKNTNELTQRIQFLSSKGVKAFNLVNKSNKDDIKHWVDVIREEIPDSDICAHYSLKYNKSRKKDGAFILFSEFVESMHSSDDNGEVFSVDGKNEILLITGSGPKGNLDSVLALERLQNRGKYLNESALDSSARMATIAVAYNPFFPSKEELEIEQERLMKKIAMKQVSKIYLQFGTDLERLRSSLDWLSKLRQEHTDLSICGSIFLPTKKLIAQQKFRPWNGVFLSEEFLDSEDGARGIILQMMRLYEDYGCEILIEAPGVRNTKDMALVEALLHDRDADHRTAGT